MSTDQLDKQVQDFTDNLPFSEEKQLAILGYALTNELFFTQLRYKVKPEWFTFIWTNKTWEFLLKFYAEHGLRPTKEELCSYKELRKLEPAEVQRIRKTVQDAYDAMKKFRIETITPELTEWLHSRIYYIAIQESAKTYNNNKDIKKAHAILKEAVREIDQTKFYEDTQSDFVNFEAQLTKIKEEKQDGLTFGLTIMDQILNPGGKGGLIAGDHTVLLAPTNSGKTTAMITIAVKNILQKKSVLFITHEGRQEDIYEKIWRCMMNCNERELHEMYKTPEGLAQMKYYSAYLARFLTYVPLNRTNLNVEDVMPVLVRLEEERRSLYPEEGGYDLLIDDYPAKLNALIGKNGQMPRRIIDERIYNEFTQFGLEYKTHVLTAVQTNREGYKATKREDEYKRRMPGDERSRLLDKDDVMESWGIMTTATNVLTINNYDNNITWYVSKSRANEVGWAVTCKSNFACQRTHGDDLGAVYYKKSWTIPEKIANMLEQYKGQELTNDILRALDTKKDSL